MINIATKFWQSYLLSRYNFPNMITIRVQLMHFHCCKLNLLKASIIDVKSEHPLYKAVEFRKGDAVIALH
jgi:hypothetical protein